VYPGGYDKAKYFVNNYGESDTEIRSISMNRVLKTTSLLAVNLPLAIASAFTAEPGAAAQPVVSLPSLLEEMVNYDSVARWPEPSFTCRQASSYDRAKVAPDKPGWFANNDAGQFIRDEENDGRRERVMMDAAGPGCIVRFWLTTNQSKKGILRIYLDGEATPALSFPAYDLLSDDLKIAPPLGQPHPGYKPNQGGNTLYLPIPYAKHCKVTWEEADSGPRYCQINYRSYLPGTPVQTFTRAALESARRVLQRVNRLLLTPPEFVSDRRVSLDKTIGVGGEASLALPAGPAAVRALELRVQVDEPAQLERALRATIMQLLFDGEDTVWCPASDFFGSGVGVNALSNWYRTIHTDGWMRCRWVMPYAKFGRITLINAGEQPVHAALRAASGPWQWDDRSMHFHCAWHYEADLATPPLRDWNYIRIAGRGVYVGDNLSLFNPVATWYGEGDEKIWVDGESFPSHLGTGTEDYYNFSFAPKPVHQTPFSSEVRMDQPMTQGHNVLTRTRNLDGIPFNKSLQFDIELISWKPMHLSNAAATYWYAFPGGSSSVRPQLREAALPVPTLAEAIAAAAPKRKPGAIECEGMKVVAKSGDFAEIELPAPDGAPHKLVIYATQAPDYGVLRFTVNGKAVAANVDGYADTVQSGPAFSLGVFEPREGRYKLRVEVVGTNPASKGAKYFFGLDCVVMEKSGTSGGSGNKNATNTTTKE
jgi:hypothetical protein